MAYTVVWLNFMQYDNCFKVINSSMCGIFRCYTEGHEFRRLGWHMTEQHLHEKKKTLQIRHVCHVEREWGEKLWGSRKVIITHSTQPGWQGSPVLSQLSKCIKNIDNIHILRAIIGLTVWPPHKKNNLNMKWKMMYWLLRRWSILFVKNKILCTHASKQGIPREVLFLHPAP